MKKWFCLMLSALTALSLGGCGGQESLSGTSLTPVTLNEVAHSIFYAPQYVAIENGYFKDEAQKVWNTVHRRMGEEPGL